MSRSFSLLLIALGLTILGSLVYLHFHLMERQHAELFDHAHKVNEQVIEQKRQEIDWLHWRTEEFFLDVIYARRSMVLDIFKEAELRLEDYFDAVEKFDQQTGGNVNPLDIQSLANAALTPVIDTAIQVFQEHHEQLDMREEDMLSLTSDFIELKGSIARRLTTSTPPSGTLHLEQDVVTLELLANFTDLLHRVASLSCYTACFTLESYFPVVMADANFVRAGETMQIKTALGSYASALQPEDVVLLIDGDTVRIGYDGTGYYTIKASELGEHTIPTKCIVTNPLTGQVRVGEGKFSYLVY